MSRRWRLVSSSHSQGHEPAFREIIKLAPLRPAERGSATRSNFANSKPLN